MSDCSRESIEVSIEFDDTASTWATPQDKHSLIDIMNHSNIFPNSLNDSTMPSSSVSIEATSASPSSLSQTPTIADGTSLSNMNGGVFKFTERRGQNVPMESTREWKRRNANFFEELKQDIKDLKLNDGRIANEIYSNLIDQIDQIRNLIDEKDLKLSLAIKKNFQNSEVIEDLQHQLYKMRNENKDSQRYFNNGDNFKPDFTDFFNERSELKLQNEQLLLRNASLTHQIDYEKREWSIERELLGMQLEDVTKELEMQRIMLSANPTNNIWEKKVRELEEKIIDRDHAIRTQYNRINELEARNRYLSYLMNED